VDHSKKYKEANKKDKNKKTSRDIALLAGNIFSNSNSTKTAKSLAASALAQREGNKQTGSAMENKASMVLNSNKYSDSI
jgi:hypothetical protein